MRPSQRVLVLLAATVVAVLCVYLRWERIEPESATTSFAEWPDGLEYVAGAQAIKDTGRHFLHLGPLELPSTYPPGWSMMLAVPLLFGASSDQLVRLPALFDAAHAALLGWFVFLLVWRLLAAGPSGDLRFPAALAAGTAAALGWTLSPLVVARGAFVMSDPASAFLCSVTLISWLMLLVPRQGRLVDRPKLMLAAGLCAGLALGIRTANPVLLMCPLLAIMVAVGVVRRWSDLGRAILPFLAGLGVVVALICWLMVRSGHGPLDWSAYEFWIPAYYSEMSVTFNWSYLTEGHRELAYLAKDGFSRLGNLDLYFRLLLGLPHVPDPPIGCYWPILGWLVAVAAAGCWLVRGSTNLPLWCRGLVLVGLATWPLGHLGLYGLYVFQSPRFILPVIPMLWVTFVLGLVYWWSRSSHRRMAASVVAILLVVVVVDECLGVARLPRSPSGTENPGFRATRQRIDSWLQLRDEQRAGRFGYVDYIAAQAMGRLSPSEAARITQWGLLDHDSGHVATLVRTGRIPLEQTSEWLLHLPLRGPFPTASRKPGRASTVAVARGWMFQWQDPTSASGTGDRYVLDCGDASAGPSRWSVRDASGREVARARTPLRLLHERAADGGMDLEAEIASDAGGPGHAVRIVMRSWGGSLHTLFRAPQAPPEVVARLGFDLPLGVGPWHDGFRSHQVERIGKDVHSAFLTVARDARACEPHALKGPAKLPELPGVSAPALSANPPTDVEMLLEGRPELTIARPRSRVMLVGRFADGRRLDLTRHAVLESSRPEVVRVDESGNIAARGAGDAEIIARLDPNHRARVRVTVNPHVRIGALQTRWLESRGELFVTFETGSGTHGGAILIEPRQPGGAAMIVQTRMDPSQQVHYAFLRELAPGRTYELQALVQNPFGARERGKAITFSRR